MPSPDEIIDRETRVRKLKALILLADDDEVAEAIAAAMHPHQIRQMLREIGERLGL